MMLREAAGELNGHVEQLVAQFNLPAATIRALSASIGAGGAAGLESAEAVKSALWQASRLHLGAFGCDS